MVKNFDVPWLHLTPDEEVLWAGHRSVYRILPPALIGVFLVVLGVVIAGSGFFDWTVWVGVLFVLIGVAVVFPPFLRWRSEWYVLTTEEVYHKRGVFTQDVTQIRLDRVQNIDYSQSVVERIFDYGTLAIHTTGASTNDLVFESVANPQTINGLLTEQLDRVSPRR